LACKHRLRLINGDITNVVACENGTFEILRELLAGSDVAAANAALESIVPSTNIAEAILPLVPPGRRKSVAAALLKDHIANGGLIKGNQSYYDVYDFGLSYQGSVKVRRGTVFSETPSSYFEGLSLVVKRLTDRLEWERSQSVYAAATGTSMASAILGGVEKTEENKALKRALLD
jgi:hypothetical protein